MILNSIRRKSQAARKSQATSHASSHATSGTDESARGGSAGFSERQPSGLGSSGGAPHVQPTHFLLYLNRETFVGNAGLLLAAEVRAARTTGLPIALAHENDLARKGCEFGRFFTTTPSDLIAVSARRARSASTTAHAWKGVRGAGERNGQCGCCCV
eukprot:5458975-Prymnesium_polylepis.1